MVTDTMTGSVRSTVPLFHSVPLTLKRWNTMEHLIQGRVQKLYKP